MYPTREGRAHFAASGTLASHPLVRPTAGAPVYAGRPALRRPSSKRDDSAGSR